MRNSLATLGFIWLVLEPAAFFLKAEHWRRGWHVYLVVLGASLIVGYLLALPRLPIERSLMSANVTIRIQEGDLLAQVGNLAVGINDCFDTTTTDGVISPNSLQGKVVANSFGGNTSALDEAIEADLALTAESGVLDTGKTYGKKTRYPIGTTVVIEQGEQRFFMVAYGYMPAELPVRVAVDKADFHRALLMLWDKVRERGQRDELHVPLLGGDFARLGMTRTQLIQVVLLSFIGTQGSAEVAPAFTLWLQPKDARAVDLPALGVWLDSVCGR